MIPQINNDLNSGVIFEEQPSLTYRMNLRQRRITGRCDGAEAIRQAVYKMLNTERYDCPIYSWNYGVELRSLLGRPVSFCIPEIERRIMEALLQDDRISGIGDFRFDMPKKGVVHVRFRVDSTKGKFEAEKEVKI